MWALDRARLLFTVSSKTMWWITDSNFDFRDRLEETTRVDLALVDGRRPPSVVLSVTDLEKRAPGTRAHVRGLSRYMSSFLRQLERDVST